MQPSPMADTSRLLLPSLRFCICFSFEMHSGGSRYLQGLTVSAREAYSVLFVADLFHPVHRLAVELFLNGDVRHGRGRRGAVPVLLTRREPYHVARPNLLDRAAPALR